MRGDTAAADWRRVTREVADDLAVDALARDRAGKPPYDEVARLREAGLPARLVPPTPGGRRGAALAAACAALRELAAADGSVGELLAHHYALAWSSRLLATAETGGADRAGDAAGASRAEPVDRAAAREGWLLAGGVEPSRTGPDLTVTPARQGHVLDGRRYFASGVTVADRLVVGARCTATGDLLVVLADPADPTVFVEPAADRVGQRVAGAGSVAFDSTPVAASQVLGRLPRDEHAVAPYAGLAPLLLRLLLVHVALGVAEGALAEARDVSRAAHAAPIPEGAAFAAARDDDPYLLLAYGELATAAHAAASVVARATDGLTGGLAAGPGLGVEERAEPAVLVAAAEAVTGRVAVHLTTRVLELVGPAATDGATGLDRFWRDARALTAGHSPAHRLRAIGDHYLNAGLPLAG
ncbi:acyl-CoA dehydrogenase family protein [Streptomyces sp. NPDC048604]|uniref:acyl-CoA dehydrogenase family protein n=1 Tax=Streptomyces sp. NPDC048604 TaxID=3365578 RepID=UPI003712DF50